MISLLVTILLSGRKVISKNAGSYLEIVIGNRLAVLDKGIDFTDSFQLASFSMSFQFFIEVFLVSIGWAFVIFQVRSFRSIISHMAFTFTIFN
jgi:hypothetical protein